MKRPLLLVSALAILFLCFAVSPLQAETTMRDRDCSHSSGSNTLKYDCGFQVKNYTVGTPVTFKVEFTCDGICGPVLSFGTRGTGFSPNGVSGRLVGGKRMENGVEVTFVFDSLQRQGTGKMAGHSKSGPGNRTGQDGNGWAHFTMNVAMDDGHDNMQSVPCDVDVHVKE